jgi:hypothetical protein
MWAAHGNPKDEVVRISQVKEERATIGFHPLLFQNDVQRMKKTIRGNRTPLGYALLLTTIVIPIFITNRRLQKASNEIHNWKIFGFRNNPLSKQK